jgi:Ca2+-binding EF-hand superfamily protein
MNSSDHPRPEEHVLAKFRSVGFNKLTLEELAVAEVSATWSQEFSKATGEDWGTTYQKRAKDRLSQGNFDLQWLTRRADAQYAALFVCALKGNLPSLLEFLKTNDVEACRHAVDDTKKTCLHVAAKEGHAEFCEVLLEKGWNIEARDRVLTTPLNYAAYGGHVSVVELLLRHHADVRAKDSVGRSCWHFACCAGNSETAAAIVANDPEVVHITDHAGRTGLHYAVFNSNSNQVDLIRTLIDAGSSLEAQDNSMKTPLAYACEGGKVRCIPILLKYGAKVTARDLQGKTPVDLASSESVRQMVLTYSQPEYRLSTRDPPRRPERPSRPQAAPQSATPRRVFAEQVRGQEPLEYGSGRKSILTALMKKVQETGVAAQQHMRKPYLFTGSWLDGIKTCTALYNSFSSCSSNEAALRVFNVLCPYLRPKPIDEEELLAGFYDDKPRPEMNSLDTSRAKGSAAVSDRLFYEEEVVSASSRVKEDDGRVKELEAVLDAKEGEVSILRHELTTAQLRINDLTAKLPSIDLVKTLNEQQEVLKAEVEELQRELRECQQAMEDLESDNTRLKADLEGKVTPEELRAQHELSVRLEAENKARRFKAGQIMLKAIDEKLLAPAAAEANVSLKDDQVIVRLKRFLVDNPPSLKLRLSEVDRDSDGKVTRSEVSRALELLKLSPQDIVTCIRIIGFRKEVRSVSIQGICALVNEREKIRTKHESELFSRLSEKLGKSNLSVEEAFDFLDVNKDGAVNFQELSEAFEMLKIQISRQDRHSLFAVLDGDNSGAISLEELKQRLEIHAAEEAEKEQERLEVSEKLKAEAQRLPKSRYQPPQEDEDIELDDDLGQENTPVKPLEVVGFLQSKDNPATIPTKPAQKSAWSAVSPLSAESRLVDPNNLPRVLSGRLSVQLSGSRLLGEGRHSVQIILQGAEEVLRTSAGYGDSVEFRFRGKFRLMHRKLQEVADAIKFQMFGEKVCEAEALLDWHKALLLPNNWAIFKELPLKDETNSAKGFVTVQVMWMPRDTIRVEGGGDLWVQLTKTTGTPVSIVQLELDGKSAVSPPGKAWTLPIALKGVKLAPDLPVPPLRCTLVELGTQAVIATRSLSWEQVLSQTDWTPEACVDLTPDCSVYLKLKWDPVTADQDSEEKAALKIQAIFRGKRARLETTFLKVLTKRKLLSRRGLKSGGRHYLVSAYELAGGKIDVELNPADDPDVPLFTELSKLTVSNMPTDLLFEKITVDAQSRLTFIDKSAGTPIYGSLVVHVRAVAGIPASFVKLILGDSCATSAAGPPWDLPVLLADMCLRSRDLLQELTLSVCALESMAEVARAEVPWEIALLSPNEWTADTEVALGDKALSVKIKWLPAAKGTVEEEQAAVKIQAAWRAKAAKQRLDVIAAVHKRTLLGRTVTKQGANFYIVTAYAVQTGMEVELHLVDQSDRPVFEPIDKITLRSQVEMKQLMTGLTISQGHKLKYAEG